MNSTLSRYFLYYPVTFLKGERITSILPQYIKNQYLEKNKIEELQLYFLKKLLKHAYKQCPYYTKLYSNNINTIHNIKSINELKQFPTITKKNIIEFYPLFSAKLDRHKVTKKTTGGSSGHPVTILKNANALAKERSATWRGYSWAGIQIGDPQARFWGTPLTKTNRIKNKFIDLIANRIRLSAFDISFASMMNYFKIIEKFKPTYLYGYVSMVDIFCHHLHNEHLKLPDSVISIITTSELLTDTIRNRIEANSGLPVFNEYGCGEVGSIAHECSKGSMHIMSDNLILEIDDNDEIIVTDLHNIAMPLIRYRLNDFAQFSDKKCSCGCNFPVLKKIYGRSYDLIHLPNGGKAHPEIVMYIFEEFKEKSEGLIQFQFIQHTIDQYSVNLVVTEQFDKHFSEKRLTQRINSILQGNFNIKYMYLQNIDRENSGKISVIKSELK